MEKEIGSSLEREDHESVFDDVVAPEPSLEGIDYATYLKIERGEMTIEEWKRQSSQKNGLESSKPKESEEKKPTAKSSQAYTKELKPHELVDSSKRLIVNLPFSEEATFFLRMAAAKDSKSVGRFIADIVLNELKTRRKEIVSYIKKGLES